MRKKGAAAALHRQGSSWPSFYELETEVNTMKAMKDNEVEPLKAHVRVEMQFVGGVAR